MSETGDLRPRRSVLYLPASNARAIEKARGLRADAIILDLEDAVAPDAKALAREQAVAALVAGGFGRREVVVRCNSLETPWSTGDFEAIGGASPDAVVVPKVSGPADVDAVADALERAGAGDGVAIWPMIETPAAIFAVRAIAAVPRVGALVIGTNDLAKELRAPLRPGRLAVLPHLATAVLAAREAGIAVLDGVWNHIHDLDGFRAECDQGVELGFDGKTLIHPNQVEIANQAWAPSDDEIRYAERVIAAYREAADTGRGVATVDGRMIENLHVQNARRALATAEAIKDLG